MVTAVEIRGYEPLFTEDNRRLCGCLAPLLSLPASQAQTKYPVLHHSIAHSTLKYLINEYSGGFILEMIIINHFRMIIINLEHH